MLNKKVHLVLGSGGARGIAHIAVIEELEKNGFEIIEVIGCSMGAVIGGIYAAGHLREYKEWLFGLNRKDVFDLMDFTFTNQGFVKGEKIFAEHKKMTGDLEIEQLSIPFTAVATDMKHNQEVYFRSGDLYQALRASVAIPGFITPVVLDGKVLVDGGVLNPLPVSLVKKQEGAIIVAVDLNARADAGLSKKKKKKKKKEEPPNWFDKLIPENIKELARKHEEEKQKKEEEAFSLLELMESTFSFTQDRLTSLMLEMYKPEIVVSIPRNTCSTFDFYKAKEVYKIGKECFERDAKEIIAEY